MRSDSRNAPHTHYVDSKFPSADVWPWDDILLDKHDHLPAVAYTVPINDGSMWSKHFQVFICPLTYQE